MFILWDLLKLLHSTEMLVLPSWKKPTGTAVRLPKIPCTLTSQEMVPWVPQAPGTNLTVLGYKRTNLCGNLLPCQWLKYPPGWTSLSIRSQPEKLGTGPSLAHMTSGEYSIPTQGEVAPRAFLLEERWIRLKWDTGGCIPLQLWEVKGWKEKGDAKTCEIVSLKFSKKVSSCTGWAHKNCSVREMWMAGQKERSGLNKEKQKAVFFLQQKSSGMFQVPSDLTGEYNKHY